MRYEIWDKVSSLNEVPAKQIIEELHFKNDDEIFLIYDEYDRLTNIENAKNIQAIYKMRTSMTVDEIAQEYIKIREEYEKNRQEQQNEEIYAREKISILESENADLLLDRAIKDSKISTLENDLADLTLEIAMMEVR